MTNEDDTTKESICAYCADGGHCEWWCKGESFVLSKKVKEAMDKQIRKKPIHDGIRHICPSCHAPLPNVAHNNCMYCGQRINWEEG